MCGVGEIDKASAMVSTTEDREKSTTYQYLPQSKKNKWTIAMPTDVVVVG
jgi:hypothetical protein